MPVLSLFYGIVIRMYREPDVRHHVPHIHAEYQGSEAVFDFDGNILEGKIPNKQSGLVKAWISIHEEDLKANWNLLNGDDATYFKIPPLQ